MILSNRRGFTIAELLITLGIIGVVAAVTIPALLEDAQSREFYARSKTVFSELSNVTNQIVNENGSVFPATGYWNHKDLYKLYKPYLSFAKTCVNNELGCWHEPNEWFNLNNVPCPDGGSCGFHGMDYMHMPGRFYHASAVLASGELLWFVKYADTYSYPGILVVDLNGFKKPNKLSRDIVLMCIDKGKARLSVCPNGGGFSMDRINVPTKGFSYSALDKYLRDLPDINNP